MKPASIALAPLLVVAMQAVAAAQEAPHVAAWTKRGGALMSYEARATATMITSSTAEVAPAQCFVQGYPSRSHDGSFGLGGGGRASLLIVAPPTGTESGTWGALRFGAGADAGYLRMPTRTFDPAASSGSSCTFTRSNEASGLLTFPLFIGAHYGIGGYRDNGARWKGIVIGLGYAPSYFYVTGNTAGGGMFNLAGFEASVDIATLDAVTPDASQPKWRFALFVLPAVTGSLPLFATVSLGAVWY